MDHDALTKAAVAREVITSQRARINELEEALRSVVASVEDYQRVNNLSPSPGKPDCWQSVTHAKAVLGE